jgi:hypothetical protein
VIAVLAAAVGLLAAPSSSPAPRAQSLVIAKYRTALAAVHDPRVFTVEYTLVQTGTRTLEQTHRIFRSGADERDETLAINGTLATSPVVRIFRRSYHYTISALAPKPDAYDFVYAGPHRDGKHVDYVFNLAPKGARTAFAFTQVTIDGVTFLPTVVAFATGAHGGRGVVTFAKRDRWWVARSATAVARVPGGVAHEELTFSHWRFPKTLPRSTFEAARPLQSVPPAGA